MPDNLDRLDLRMMGPEGVQSCLTGEGGFRPDVKEQVERIVRNNADYFSGPLWADVRRQLGL